MDISMAVLMVDWWVVSMVEQMDILMAGSKVE
jgi:hypothetical protein